jgi:ribokinase
MERRVPKIVNLGSLCFDRVYHVPAMVRTGETLRATAVDLFPGGKGLNQSLAARRAGAAVQHVGCVGADGEPLRALLQEAGVDVTHLRLQEDIPTAHAVIQLTANGDNAIVIVGGSNLAIRPADIDVALASLGEGDWLLLQNEINDLETVLQRAHAQGAQVCMNLAPYSTAADAYPLGYVALLIVNENEAHGLTGEEDPERALAALRRRCPATTVVVTLGEAGLIHDAGEGIVRVPPFVVHTVDGTGAGDAFIGYLLASLQLGASLPRALVLGSAAGALAASRAGAATSIPTRTEVETLVARAGAAAP